MERCLLCRREDGLASFKQTNKTSKKENISSRSKVYDLWGEKCTVSFCRLLKIQESHPIRNFVRNADYCQDCLQLMRDIDFTLRQLDNLQQQILGFREDLLSKLEINYQRIPDLQSIKSKARKRQLGFDEVVKTIYENVGSNTLTAVDFLKNNYTRIRIRNALEQCDIKKELNADQNEDFEDQPILQDEFMVIPEIIIPSSVTPIKIDYSKSYDENEEESQIFLPQEESSHEMEDEDPLEMDPDWNVIDSEAESIKSADNKLDIGDIDINNKTYKKGQHKKKKITKKILKSNQTKAVWKKNFDCSYENCGREFTMESILIRHIRKVHEGDPNPYHCNLCEAKYSSRDVLLKHLIIHKLNDSKTSKKFPCQEVKCVRGFDNESDLQHHMRKIHEGDPTPFHCEICSEKYSYLEGLRRHMNRHNSGKFSCKECDKIFIIENNLILHNKNHHDSETKQWICSFCRIKCKSKEELGSHEDFHRSREVPFSCLICNENCTSSNDLMKHMKSHDDKKPICDTCGKRFSSENSLHNHRKLHDPSFTKYQCSHCDQKFTSASLLERHMPKHSEEKKHICEKCGKSFKYQSALKIHSRRHDNNNPFKCKICGKGFIASHYLKKHEQIHSGIRAYECKLCDKTFRTEANLQKHGNTHKPKDPNKKPKIIGVTKKSGETSNEEWFLLN